MNNEAPQQKTPPTLRQDCALVTHFMAYNGGYVLRYENAVEIRKSAAFILFNTPASKVELRYEVAQDAKKALEIINEVKPKMIHIHVSPEEWTIEDLKKLKADPKGKKVFAALVRVRDAIYDPTVDADLRKELAKNLLDTMPPGTASSELRGLLDRVKTVNGGKVTNLGALLDKDQGIKLNPLDDNAFDQQAALAMLDASGVKADTEHTLKAPLETLVTNAVKGIKQSVSLAA
ncbi:MAG: hypothetical protein J7527_02800 [Chitinophagaceae bacterium]|nr:hypothetical protein [Chitinophagaceae bacterium]